jgi:DNA-binding XRE family transcriptional regulator
MVSDSDTGPRVPGRAGSRPRRIPAAQDPGPRGSVATHPGECQQSGIRFNALMPAPLRLTFARLCRDTRTALDITQQTLADAVGVSRAHIASVESGRCNPSLDLVVRIGDTLGLELDLVAHPPVVIAGRQREIVHARCSGYLDRQFRRAGWVTKREFEVVHGRSHGWIDLLAFDRRTGTLVIVEIKTRLDDLGAIERQLGWYERNVDRIGRQLGWRPKRMVAWLVMLASEEVETALRSNREALAVGFPVRADEMARILRGEAPTIEGRGLALIDPSSRRREWLIRSRLDGRRAMHPYRDYADAARRFSR